MSVKSEAILAAARAVLVREGGAGFSMRKVAQAADMSLGNLQYHFPSRSALVDGLLAFALEEYRREIVPLASGPGEGKARLRAAIAASLRQAGDREELALFRSLFGLSEPEVVDTPLERFYRGLYDLIREGLAELSGRAPESPAVHRAASLLLPYLDGYELAGPVLGIGPDDLAELLADAAWALLLAAEATSPGPPRP